MYYLDTAGGPFERGVAHGRAAADRIAWLVDHYREGFRGEDGAWKPGLTPEARREQVSQRASQIIQAYLEGYEEIRGIAAGAGMDVEDILELNVVFELTPAAPPGCTVYGFQDAQGRALMGKSDDLWLDELGCNALGRVQPAEGLASVQLHYVGTIWTSASVNAAGFAFGMTGLTGSIRNPDGMPGLFLLHQIASRCTAVREAEDFLAGMSVEADGFSLIAGDATGDLAVIQKHVTGQESLRPERPGQAVWHTNHCTGGLSGADDPACAFLANSRARDWAAREADPGVDRSVAGLQALYRMHGAPHGLCQHGQAGLHTDSAVLLAPDDRTMWITEGYPCENKFVAHQPPIR